MVEITNNDGIYVARFKDTDRFNASVAEDVKEALTAVYSTPNSSLVMDLSAIKFIDSSGFSVFLSVMKAANNNYGEFKIASVNQEVKELFKVLQLHNIFEMYDSLEDAIESLNN